MILFPKNREVGRMKSFQQLGLYLAVSILMLAMPPQAKAQLFFMPDSLIGKAAPEFTLKNLEGKELSMTKYRDGQSAVIFFWATWCPHCRTALKGLHQKKAEFETKGIKLILVDLGESAEEVREHLFKTKMDLDVFLDMDTALSEIYGIIGVPTFFLVNKDGVVKQIDHALPKNYEEILLP